jgi:hypothetical protein
MLGFGCLSLSSIHRNLLFHFHKRQQSGRFSQVLGPCPNQSNRTLRDFTDQREKVPEPPFKRLISIKTDCEGSDR